MISSSNFEHKINFIAIFSCFIQLSLSRTPMNALDDDKLLLVEDPPRTGGLLYPVETPMREVRKLDGVWRFLQGNSSDSMQGLREKWFASHLDEIQETIPMPVPSSYNDITTSAELRDHVGVVWYECGFFAPRRWLKDDQRVWLRFGGVHYSAFVWLNGILIAKHFIGHLPFEVEITRETRFGDENRLTVMCNNTLQEGTIPQGTVSSYETDEGFSDYQDHTFDFFNYAGIHRSVHLYTTPRIFIQDIELSTDLEANQQTGYVHYNVSIEHEDSGMPENEELIVHLRLNEFRGEIVAYDMPMGLWRRSGTIQVDDVRPWWPYLMDSNEGYMYMLDICLHFANETLVDLYRMKVGIRKLTWNSEGLAINFKPVYFHGFGRHEDADIRGKGLDWATLTRDFNLLKWIGANVYRTSHYPYSEESMQFADEHGIMIIDECPSTDTSDFQPNLLRNHMSAMEQLIHRDRNHASVVMWSLANEPQSDDEKSEVYFGILTEYTRSLDATRPLTAALAQYADTDKLSRFLDVIGFNRYNAWYFNAGHTNTIVKSVIDEAQYWRSTFKKPIMITEYGGDAIEGLPQLPSVAWSEHYQTELLAKHFEAFDKLRKKKWFLGELIWNFADFKTDQSSFRVGGINKKGVFTRQRQPKAAAYLIRQRYYGLEYELNNCTLPDDLFPYTATIFNTTP